MLARFSCLSTRSRHPVLLGNDVVRKNRQTRAMESTRSYPILQTTARAASFELHSETSRSEIERIFQLQSNSQYAIANTTSDERRAKIQRFRDVFMSHQDDVASAAYEDKGNHPYETRMSEIYAVTHEIRHICRNLARWMKPERVGTPLSMVGTQSWIHYEPKGVALIISPWNFPVNLTLCPLITAVAAGNCAIVKPSEMTPNVASVLRKVVEEAFDEDEVAVVEGGIETSTALLEQPFNHIFFTGSPAVGKIVMTAAAKNLCSVTLELGGKSPVIIDETANIDIAANRMSWGKTMNNGQICISPDYVFVHESKKDEFVEKFINSIKNKFGEEAQKSKDYSRIINGHHHSRLAGVIEDAKARGAQVEYGGRVDASDKFIEPTVLSNVDSSSKVMTDEIFGPILPVNTFATLEEPIAHIQGGDKPLALYIYSNSRTNIDHIIRSTRAGGTCINHNIAHFLNSNLPFGGSNTSGIGKSHGIFGFKEFSNSRAVLKQISPVSGIDLMMPPYDENTTKQQLIDLSVKYF